jgi:simple sugar transport system permease protein
VNLRSFVAPALAVAVAVAAGHVLIVAAGAAPREVFGALFAGTWGNAYGFGQVLFKATPLVLAGLAVALPYRAGLFNIGAEGQAVVGALAAGVLGAALPAGTPGIVAVPVCVGAALLGGGAWGALAGWLRARFGAHEVITSIMLNFIALALANWLVADFLAEPETLHTAPIVDGARLSRLGAWIPALRGSAVNTAVLLVPVLVLGAWWLVYRTPAGHRLRSVGLAPRAAEASGVSAARVTTAAMALGGGIAGLVGVNFVQGYKGYFEDGFSGGVGFMGIAVAMLARGEPLALVPAALLFGTLSQGGLAINALVPKEIVDILVAVVVVVASAQAVRRRG